MKVVTVCRERGKDDPNLLMLKMDLGQAEIWNSDMGLIDNVKMLLGFDIINLLDQKFFYNTGEGSIGLGIAHAGTPRSYFFRAQWFF